MESFDRAKRKCAICHRKLNQRHNAPEVVHRAHILYKFDCKNRCRNKFQIDIHILENSMASNRICDDHNQLPSDNCSVGELCHDRRRVDHFHNAPGSNCHLCTKNRCYNCPDVDTLVRHVNPDIAVLPRVVVHVVKLINSYKWKIWPPGPIGSHYLKSSWFGLRCTDSEKKAK